MKKRFIILFDFSEDAENLLKYAYDWSKQVGVEILLLHQTTVLVPAFADNESRILLTNKTNSEALNKLEAIVKRIFSSSLRVTYSVSEKPLQIRLQEYLDEAFENLIFIALKKMTLTKKILLGSTAIQLIDKTNNNIVAMPKDISSFSHEQIYVAVTEKKPLNILAFNNLLSFMDKSKTRITFFYLADPNEETKAIEKHLRDLTKLFATKFDASFTIYEKHNYFTDIKAVINNKIDELLVIQKGSRHLTDQLFRRFLIDDLVFEGQTPLIILP